MKKSLELKIPPAVVFLLCAVVMWILASPLSAISIDIPGRRVLAVIVAGIGISIGVAGVLAFRGARTTVDPRYPEKASTVVTAGIYQRSRNPMYVGLLLLLLAWGIFLADALAFIGLPVFLLYMNRFQIAPEERAMQEQFGDDYRDYMRVVRRWI